MVAAKSRHLAVDAPPARGAAATRWCSCSRSSPCFVLLAAVSGRPDDQKLEIRASRMGLLAVMGCMGRGGLLVIVALASSCKGGDQMPSPQVRFESMDLKGCLPVLPIPNRPPLSLIHI